MKKLYSILIYLILLLLPLLLLANDIPLKVHQKYFLPLGKDRTISYNKLKDKIIGKYGENRTSKVRGHRHAGIDIQGDFNETVYSIGEGIVIDIFRNFPHKTIFIQHNENTDTPFYSVYIHVEDIHVHIGDEVTKDTPLGRIFNREELETSNFETPPHLHFEIRHNLNDKGEATFHCMSISELNKYCLDPMIFFKKVLTYSSYLTQKGEYYE